MKLAICNETWGDLDFAATCGRIAAAGFQGIEIAPFTLKENPWDLSVNELKAHRAVATAAGLDIIGLHWLLKAPAGFHISSPDPAIRRRTHDFLRHLVEVNAELGGRILVFGSPNCRSLGTEIAPEEGWKRSREIFRDIAEYAHRHGAILALEPLSPIETDFLSSAAEGERMVEEVAHPGCKLHLDVKAMAGELLCRDGFFTPESLSLGIAELIRRHRRHLVHFHANDPNRRGPGTGIVDYAPIFAALRDIDYQAWLSVEVFDYAEGADEIARNSADFLRRG